MGPRISPRLIGPRLMGPRLMGLPLLMGVLAIAAAASPATAGSGGTGSSNSCGCAPTTHQVVVPGVTITPPQINIGLPSIGVGVGQASASGVGTASASAQSSTNVSVSTSGSSSGSASTAVQSAAALLGSSGGSGSWGAEGGVTTEIQDIKVESPAQPPPPVAMPPICAAWKTVVRQVAVQASCLDDKAVPHPASQVSPDRAVAPGYEGEVFRCIAGARMQYTVAEFSGQADFNHGQTIVCQKGEALYHSATGALQCRPQAPARDCNERSLLRRFGAGIKVLALSGAQVCATWRPQTVAAAPGPGAGPLVLN